MARIKAAAEGAKTKDFKVSAGYHMMSPNSNADGTPNKRLKGGDYVALTKSQAEYYLGMGAITLELADFDADVDDKPAPAKAKAGDEAEGNRSAEGGKPSAKKAI